MYLLVSKIFKSSYNPQILQIKNMKISKIENSFQCAPVLHGPASPTLCIHVLRKWAVL